MSKEPIVGYLPGARAFDLRGRTLVKRQLPGLPPLYKTWHDKEPRTAVRARYQWPSVVHPFCRARTIYYFSAKWEKDNTGYAYVHEFPSKPDVWMEIDRPDVPGMQVDSVLRNSIKDGHVNLPVLAVVLHLELEGEDGIINCTFEDLPDGAPSLCASDDRTLVIPHPKAALFIRGGNMRVTARGIVG